MSLNRKKQRNLMQNTSLSINQFKDKKYPFITKGIKSVSINIFNVQINVVKLHFW